MKEQELKTLLAALTPPTADEATRGRALHRATLALAGAGDAPREADNVFEKRVSYRWAALCVVMLIAGLVMVGPLRLMRDAEPGADLRTLAQVEELFPGQLNAVIEGDGEMRLDLARWTAPSSTDQPVVVELERGGNRLRVLSYSGRSVTMELKGRRVTFDVLVTSDGGVVLAGDDFAWSSTERGSLAGYRVHARSLSEL